MTSDRDEYLTIRYETYDGGFWLAALNYRRGDIGCSSEVRAATPEAALDAMRNRILDTQTSHPYTQPSAWIGWAWNSGPGKDLADRLLRLEHTVFSGRPIPVEKL